MSPLAGLIDPGHDERAADEPGRLPRWMSVEELLETAENPPLGPRWSPWTYELIHAALEEWQERDYISTTMLTGDCLRGKVVERKEEFILSLDDMYKAVRGTQVHRTLEKSARPGSVAEARFFTTVWLPAAHETIALSCSPDLVTRDTLWDYKVSEPPAYQYPRREHTRQVNYNRFIINHAADWFIGLDQEMPFDPRTWRCEHLALVYLGEKWPKVIECTKKQPVTFKSGKEGTRAMPYVWTDEEVLEGEGDEQREGDGLLRRLEGMVLALKAYPEWPAGLEEYPDFAGPPSWACPGPPRCWLPRCMARRFPNGFVWESP